jgi:hypothetical protein
LDHQSCLRYTYHWYSPSNVLLEILQKIFQSFFSIDFLTYENKVFKKENNVWKIFPKRDFSFHLSMFKKDKKKLFHKYRKITQTIKIILTILWFWFSVIMKGKRKEKNSFKITIFLEFPQNIFHPTLQNSIRSFSLNFLFACDLWYYHNYVIKVLCATLKNFLFPSFLSDELKKRTLPWKVWMKNIEY